MSQSATQTYPFECWAQAMCHSFPWHFLKMLFAQAAGKQTDVFF
jgi:hypothetical protein